MRVKQQSIRDLEVSRYNKREHASVPVASPQTSFGVRSSRIHFSVGEKWMRAEGTPKDVCGEATVAVDVSHSKTPLLSRLNHNIKIQILIFYPYTFAIEVVGRICWSIK